MIAHDQVPDEDDGFISFAEAMARAFASWALDTLGTEPQPAEQEQEHHDR